MNIRQLFDPSRDIYRNIEKVITYNASQEERLKAEISEYVVTESIEEQMRNLLELMERAMDSGGQNEIGVWVSGFYGSGKSSFTKYLGLALDQTRTIGGTPFLKYLQDRVNKPQTKALLGTVASRFPAAIVLLDLASEMLAGATMEEVSTVLYYKVLQWAGYSRNLKVAAFERRLQKDGRFDEFTSRIRSELDTDWKEVQNDPLVIDSLIPEIAHEMYPGVFKSAGAFSTETEDYVQFENERVQEMLDIVRESSGKEYALFVVDEVGQYVGSRQNLILNLDGLAKNLKAVGEGRAWIVGTAQQTLTEDDPRASLNSPELYKLQARFPIQIDLESKDIKEICYRRLLAKSAEGSATLAELFDKHGQSLRHNTKLQDAQYYDSDFTKKTFVNLYPFLPAHFDILLQLLGALAKSTGGIGLRSAIKVVQDILIEGPGEGGAVADRPVGWIATTVTLYDVLEKDINRAFPAIHQSVSKTLIRFPDSSSHQHVAKTVAILQILANMPVTAQNVAALLHPGVDAESQRQETDAAIQELMSDSIVPFGERDGNLCFFSEKLNEIEKERASLPLRTAETRRIRNEALREALSPSPSVKLHGSLTVTTGLKAADGSFVSSLAGERETVQSIFHFVDANEYNDRRATLVNESREHNNRNTIYVIARSPQEVADKVAQIFRSREIVQRHKNDPDSEVRDYCASQTDRTVALLADVQNILKRSVSDGSFIFRGETTAVNTLDQDALEAAKKHLKSVAEQVFSRYEEAPVRAETALAEKFLRAGSLSAVTSQIDPLKLVKVHGGTPSVDTGAKPIVSIHDYLDTIGSIDGKRMADHFTDAPFGWSPDTLRYLIATMLVAGEIKLKISGREVTVNGQQAIDALRTNNSFKPVGISLRNEKLSNEELKRAADRLTELVGESVIPLEDEISKAATKHFPTFQLQFGSLAERLESLGVPGADVVRSLNQELADVLSTDGSDAPTRLGSQQSALYDGLKWAIASERALKDGLAPTIQELQEHRREFGQLPDSGIPGRLRQETADELNQASARLDQEDFYLHAAELSTLLTSIKSATESAANDLRASQEDSIKQAKMGLQAMPEWPELTADEQSRVLKQIEEISIDYTADLAGIKRLLSRAFSVNTQIEQIRQGIVNSAKERQLARLDEERKEAKKEGCSTLSRRIKVPKTIANAADLQEVIRELQALKAEFSVYEGIEVTFEIEE